MLEKKSVLARLLANENITVQQGNFETAYFDVVNRVLGLPLFKDMSNDLYDLMIGHEVSHALYTPADPETLKVEGVPFSFVNIVEDIRIEKMILRKYPGLVANFKRGYLELIDSNFFNTNDEPLEKKCFMDRLNLKAKGRDLIDIPFSSEEKPYFDLAMSVETFDDVVEAVKKIAEWLSEEDDQPEQQDSPNDSNDNTEKNENQEKQSQPESQNSDSDESQDEESESESDETESGEESDSKSSEESDASDDSDEDSDSQDDEKSETKPDATASDEDTEASDAQEGSTAQGSPDEVKTVKGKLEEASTDVAQHENMKTLVESSSDTVYAQGMTREFYNKVKVDYKEVLKNRNEVIQSAIEYGYDNRIRRAEEKWLEFKASAKPVVNLMAKEFEMRKAAYRTKRAMTSTKGSLDVNKLHAYKYDDQLFKQVTTLANGKNHGLIMLVDYSGSMHNVMPNVIKQNATLVMFCKKVGIPFEVYGFTSKNYGDQVRENTTLTRFDTDDFNLFNIYSSKMTKAELETALMTSIYQADDTYFRPRNERLGNTPLNAAMMAMEFAYKDFRKANNIEKMTFVTLTDGESNYPRVVHGIDSENVSWSATAIVPVNGKNIKTERYDTDGKTTGEMMNAVFGKEVTKINFYVCDNRGLRQQLYSHLAWDEKAQKEARKEMRTNGAWILDNNSGYDRRFIILDKNASLSGETEDLEVDDKATPAQIAKAFKKFSGSKKGNRIITKKFAEAIA